MSFAHDSFARSMEWLTLFSTAAVFVGETFALSYFTASVNPPYIRGLEALSWKKSPGHVSGFTSALTRLRSPGFKLFLFASRRLGH